jgi:flagellar motility protein MotE (MotC chaperone)
MTHSVKDQLAADFDKAKSAGSARIGRIRQIFQEALTQTVTELKQGTGEIGSIAKDSTSALTENLKNAQKSASPEVVPVQVEIQDEGTETVSVENSIEDTVLPPTAEEVVIEIMPQASSQQAEPASESFVDSLKALIEQVVRSLREGEAYATLQQQLTKLKQQMTVLDAKLSERYGDRYEGFKQEFNQDIEKTKAWYEGMKTDANASGMNVLEYKQAELVIKMGEVGVTIAQKEEKIKQRLKELWQTTTKD